VIEALAVELVTFHMVDGRVVQINPAQVTQLVHPKEGGNKALIDKVKCVIVMTDGNFVSIAETCEEATEALKLGEE
jgi:hypothetical protein